MSNKMSLADFTSLQDAKIYLEKCGKGLYSSSNYHKAKCRKILDAFGEWLYNGSKESQHLFDIAVSMIENNQTK